MPSFFKITDQKNPIAALDGVRAIACFTVIFYHINLVTSDKHIHIWTPDMIGPLATAIAVAGWGGVTLFFVLSGFLLFMPYARAILFNTKWPDWKRYYIRRIFRIWPGYFASLLLMLLWLHPEYFQPRHWLELGLFLTFFMDSASRTYQAVNGPFWTLAVEWQFYVILPLLALAFLRLVRHRSLQKRLWMLTLCIGGIALWGLLSRAWGQNWAPNPHHPLFLLHRGVLLLFYGRNGKFLEDFAVGMFISVCYVLFQERGCTSRIVLSLKRYSDWFWGIGILWLFFIGIWYISPSVKSLLQPLIGDHAVFTEISCALGYGSCLIAVLFGPAYFRRPLEWEPLRCLGQLSYGIYMWHLVLLLWFVRTIIALAQYWHPFFAYSLCWGWIVCIVIPFCYFFYLFIERPGINLGVKLLKRKVRRRETEVRALSRRETGEEQTFLCQMQEN